MEQDHKSRVDQSSNTAEDFTKHYYEGLDRRRHMMSRFYLDTATLIWNGNGIAGKDVIQKFFEELPTTDHIISSIDSQPFTVNIPGCPSPIAFVLNIAGFVGYGEEQPVAFHQQLLITAEADKWKIVSDCFRFQEGPSV